MAKCLVLKGGTGKEVGGWWEAGRSGIPGSVRSKHC